MAPHTAFALQNQAMAPPDSQGRTHSRKMWTGTAPKVYVCASLIFPLRGLEIVNGASTNISFS